MTNARTTKRPGELMLSYGVVIFVAAVVLLAVNMVRSGAPSVAAVVGLLLGVILGVAGYTRRARSAR
jgi:xanthosine utilization system XapX-like protein